MAEPLTVLITSWVTPSSLFIFVNLVIGTIAITSRFAAADKRQAHQDTQHLVRSPSLLQRVRSFRLSAHYYNYDPAPFSEPECADHPQLIRAPSLLERVRSFRLGHYSEAQTAECTQQPQLVRTPSLLERVRSFNFGPYAHESSQHAETEHVRPESDDPNLDNRSEPKLDRAPSLLQRLQSMNLSRFYRSDAGEEESEPETECSDSDSDSDPGGVSGKEEVAEKMRKSASERARGRKSEWDDEDEEAEEKQRPARTRSEAAAAAGDEEVDAKADDFINRFKKQLRLQRVDSILRYREMLRGN